MKVVNHDVALLFATMTPLVFANTKRPPKCVLNRGCGNGEDIIQDELCAINSNGLDHFVNCVYGEGKRDLKLCSFSLGYEQDTLQNFQYWYDVSPTLGCISPKEVIARASLNFGQSSLHGAIQFCPSDNGRFHECLCHHNIRDGSVTHLAARFGNGNPSSLHCNSAKKRDVLVEPPPGLMASLRKRDISDLVYDAGYAFIIDDDGRPNYDNGAIGYPLPYYQSFIWENTGIERCYIMPFSTNQYCVEWLLPEYMESSPWVQGPWTHDNATYGATLQPSTTATTTSTQSVQPPVVSDPSSTTLPTATGVTSTTEVATKYPVPAPGGPATASIPSQIPVSVAAVGAPTGSSGSGGGKTNGAAAAVPAVIHLCFAFGLQLFMAMY